MPHLKRSVTLVQATAINVIDMVGIGPFVALSFVMSSMGGTSCMLAWILGAILALADSCTWAHLGAALPHAGGSYVFLQHLYGKQKWGRLFSFLYIWQTTIQAPLVIASGAIGFATYCQYIAPLSTIEMKCISAGLVLLIVALLYRNIQSIGRMSVVLGIVVLAIMLWMIISGLILWHNTDISWRQIFNVSQHPSLLSSLNDATLKTIYCYLGYYNVCHIGGEIQNPTRNIPRSIFYSVIIIAILYLSMQWSVLQVVTVAEANTHEFVVSLFFEKLYNRQVALVATCGILFVAFASLFAVVLGYSRVPYAAAVDGNYFPIFARIHARLQFPHASLLILGSVAFIFSLLFKMKEIISAIIVVRILIQFVSQAIGLIIFHQRVDGKGQHRMWWFPLPSMLSIVIWLYIFGWSKWPYILGAFAIIISGCILYLALAHRQRKWPYAFAKHNGDPPTDK